MNRTGLFIALGLALVVGLLFGLYPELDLKLAALFYDTATRSFPLKLNAMAALARDGAMWIAWGLALPTIAALVVKLVRPAAPGGRDAVQRRSAVRAVVGSARRLRPQLFVLLRRGRYRILELCARG